MKKRWMKLAAIGIMAGTMLIQTPVSIYAADKIVAPQTAVQSADETESDKMWFEEEEFKDGEFIVVDGYYKFKFNDGTYAKDGLYTLDYKGSYGYERFAFDEDGDLVVKWYQDKNGNWYYFDEDDVYLYGGGLWEIDGAYYAFDADCIMLSGQWYNAEYIDPSYWFYLDAGDGHAVTGWNKINGKWYYMEPDGGLMLTGWQNVDGKWYYMNGSGAMVTGWNKISGKWYYMNGSGAMVTGWQKIGGKWYYMNGSGAMVTGWNKIGGKWYYMNGSGAMLTGWQKIGGKWYYMNGSGAMLTGRQKIGGKWYRFNASGVWIK